MKIKVVNLPVKPSGDVVDWLDSDGNAIELQRLADAEPLWFPDLDARRRRERQRRLNAERQRRFRAKQRAFRLAISA